MRDLLSKSLILSSPGLISLIISLIAIPIHLNEQGFENYGKYIFFHFILSLGLLINLGIGKMSTIVIGQNIDKLNSIISQNLKYTLIKSSIYFLFYLSVNFFLNLNHDFLIFFIGLTLTSIYFSFEGIFLGEKKFMKISILNLLFFSLSLNVPSLMLFYQSYSVENLILFSIIIKLFTITLMIIEYLKNMNLSINKNNILEEKILQNYKWISMNLLNIQISNFIDKYLVKIFLGLDLLSKYSIPQQLSGKLSIFSQGFSAFLLQNLSVKKNQNTNLITSIFLFFYLMPIIIFLAFPLFNKFLIFWLDRNYEFEIFNLFKIFVIYAVFSSTSHLVTSKFEANFKIKNNFKIELICLIPFAILIFIATKNNFSLLNISIIMLIKEVLLLSLRLRFFRRELRSIQKKYFYNLFLIIIILYSSFFNYVIFYSIILIIYLPFLINEFYKLYSSKNF